MNKVFLIGRLTHNPEIIKDNENSDFATFSMAVDKRYGKNGENDTNFFNCVSFGSNVSFIEKYLSKGMKIAICGRLDSGSYINSKGDKVYTVKVIIDEIDFAESKRVQTDGSNV